MNSLQPGTYRLKYDVINPNPDRRANQFRASSWQQSHNEYPQNIKIYFQGGSPVYSFTDLLSGDKPRVSTLVANLEPIEESASDYLVRKTGNMGAGRTALAMLDKLNLPLAEVERLLAEIEAEEMAAGEVNA